MQLDKLPIEIIEMIKEKVIFTPKSNDELKGAVVFWICDRKKALKDYGHISTWDTKNITDMSYLFAYNYHFNDDISKWNTSKVKSMKGMFKFANRFNSDISNWDVSNVEDMTEMFYNCWKFNRSINKWNTKNLKYKENMLYNSLRLL